ncbi:hypothetical protein VTJ83DRAFT_3969 [Remersonia thermophila]|uniref:Uncharacterized protein n=1 Tax=Remersonia thermophila TaxID=72144 RepID=A0ABR4DFI2_9PEZI
MYSILPQTPPRFSFGSGAEVHHHLHRPAFSSPLSSSPIRASSPSPPPPGDKMQEQQPNPNQPLTPWGPNTSNARPQHTQSSPIFPSRTGLTSPTTPATDQNAAGFGYGTNPKFRFASRSSRPNPVLRRREDAQESRRRLFLQNVRQRQEDRRWEMRGGEDELLKLEWQRLSRERQQALEAEFAQFDIDLAAREEEEELRWMQQQRQMLTSAPNPHDRDLDAMMADVIAQQEEAEMQALLEALESGGRAPAQEQPRQQQQQQQQLFSDDDYDDVFMDLIHQEESQSQMAADSQDVEMS